MNSGIRTGHLNRWRDGLGLCCICGQIMGVPSAARKVALLARTRQSRGGGGGGGLNSIGQVDINGDDEDGGSIANIDSDGLLLTEECPIRLCMYQFNILGERQNAHIVDDYTFLEGGRAAGANSINGGGGGHVGKSFRDKFNLFKDTIIPLHPLAFDSFRTQVLGTTETAIAIYNSAAANCQRTVADLTVGGCKRCNKAMDRSSMHANAVYRCFKLTQDSNNPLLETNSLNATAIKKVIQQIALYFEPVFIFESSGTSTTSSVGEVVNETTTAAAHASPPPYSSSLALLSTERNPHLVVQVANKASSLVAVSWRAKTAEALLRDAATWRCIAHLCCWGLTSIGDGARFRMIAVFHASYYIYERGNLKGILPFEMWHLYVWRPFYMLKYTPETFFGMNQSEVNVNFNLSRQDGARWMIIIQTRLQCVGDELESQWNPDRLIPISKFISDVAKEIYDERSLVRFFCNANNTENGVKKIFEYFEYNISGGNAGPQLLRKCAEFKKKLVRQYNLIAHTEYNKKKLLS